FAVARHPASKCTRLCRGEVAAASFSLAHTGFSLLGHSVEIGFLFGYFLGIKRGPCKIVARLNRESALHCANCGMACDGLCWAEKFAPGLRHSRGHCPAWG